MIRLATLLFSFWLTVVLGDPGVLHACPMHSGHGTEQSAPVDHSSHGAHAPASEGTDTPPSSGPCTCIEECSSAPAATVVPSVETYVVSHAIVGIAELAEPVCDDHESSPDVRLQYANGPPTA